MYVPQQWYRGFQVKQHDNIAELRTSRNFRSRGGVFIETTTCRFAEVFAAPATSAELLLPIMHKFWQSEVFYVFHTVLFGSYGRYQWTMLSFFKRF